MESYRIRFFHIDHRPSKLDLRQIRMPAFEKKKKNCHFVGIRLTISIVHYHSFTLQNQKLKTEIQFLGRGKKITGKVGSDKKKIYFSLGQTSFL